MQSRIFPAVKSIRRLSALAIAIAVNHSFSPVSQAQKPRQRFAVSLRMVRARQLKALPLL